MLYIIWVYSLLKETIAHQTTDLNMIRILFLQLFFIVFIGNSLYAQNKRKVREISTAKSLEYNADSLLEQKDYENAVGKFHQAAVIFEKNKLWINAVKNYRQTASCFLHLEKVDSAQYLTNYAYKLLIKKTKQFNEQERFEESELYYTQVNIFLEKRKIDSAFQSIEKGLKIMIELNRKYNAYNHIIPRYYEMYGFIYFLKGNYDDALKYSFKALEIRQKELAPAHFDIISCNYMIAQIYYCKRDYEKAEQYFQYIINNCPNEYMNFAAHSYVYMGILYKLKNEYYKTLEYYNKGLAIYKETEGEYSYPVAITINNIGLAYGLLGDHENALANLKTAISIWKKCLGDTHITLIKSLISFASYYNQAGKYNEALDVIYEAFEILKINNSTEIVYENRLYNILGLTHIELNKNQEAVEYFQHAIAIIIDGFEFNDDLKNPEIFLKGTNIPNPEFKIAFKTNLYENLINKANGSFKIYNQDTLLTDKLKESLNTYKLAFQLLDLIRIDISDDESKFLLGENEKENYINAINISLKLDSLFPEKQYSNYVLEYVDKCKGASLRDKSYNKNALKNSEIPEDLVEKVQNIEGKLAFYNTQINKNTESELINGYIENFNNLEVIYDTLCNFLEKEYPKYYKLTHSNAFNINEIKSRIKDNEVIIEYLVMDKSILIITVNNEDYEIVTVNIDSTFKENIFKFYRSIRKVETANYITTNSVLYEKLIEPVKDRIVNKNNLIIIPDDYLFYVPFESIYNNINSVDNMDFRKFNYLIKDYEIRYNYSLNFWRFNKILSNVEKTYYGDFIGFAPVFEDIDKMPTANLNYNDTITRSATIDGKRFTKLQYSEKEINEISNLFLERNKKTNTFFYNIATEDNFKNNVFGYKYIHISTHGFSNEINPNLSGLAFYASDTNNIRNFTGIQDGLLFSNEISNLNLNANLVVLSACETGIGKLVAGEGLIAISRGFINSGIPNIIYSLWNVADKNTSDLMIEFYKEVLSGKSYSQSLRNVKLKMIEDINTSFPKNWSSFLLVGI